MDALRGLKILVLVMSVLIIGGIGLVGYGVYSKLTGNVKGSGDDPTAVATTIPDDTPVPVPNDTPVPVPGITVPTAQLDAGTIALGQPAGSRIVEARPDGAVLTLRVEGGGLDDRVILVDLREGRVIGAVHVGAAPAP